MDKYITLQFNTNQNAVRNARKGAGSNVPVPVVGGVLRGIKGYEGLYAVTNTGNVISLNKKVNGKNGNIRLLPKCILKFEVKKGYHVVTLSKNNKRKQFFVHRLVAIAFIKNNANAPFINHIDNNRANNVLSNLEWCTHKQNIQHAVKQSRMAWGEKSGAHKLKTFQVLEIRALRDKLSQREIGTMYKIDHSVVSDIQTGKIWKNLI